MSLAESAAFIDISDDSGDERRRRRGGGRKDDDDAPVFRELKSLKKKDARLKDRYVKHRPSGVTTEEEDAELDLDASLYRRVTNAPGKSFAKGSKKAASSRKPSPPPRGRRSKSRDRARGESTGNDSESSLEKYLSSTRSRKDYGRQGKPGNSRRKSKDARSSESDSNSDDDFLDEVAQKNMKRLQKLKQMKDVKPRAKRPDAVLGEYMEKQHHRSYHDGTSVHFPSDED